MTNEHDDTEGTTLPPVESLRRLQTAVGDAVAHALHTTVPPTGNAAPQEAVDFVTVAEAARLVGVTANIVYYWIGRGMLTAQPGRHGRRVSLAAVRALAEAPVPVRRRPEVREIPDDTAEYVSPSAAARVVVVPSNRVFYWAKTGRVASRQGRYGRLVRLVDVQAYAASRTEE